MDGSAAAKAQEQFLALANSSNGRAAVELIKNILAHRALFAFCDFLSHPNVSALRGTDHGAWLELLEVFAYGTYADYVSRKLPPIDEAQTRKLRMLSIVSEAAKAKTLPYAALQERLHVSDVRELEDLIIGCVEAGLLAGRMDQRRLVFLVEWATARDTGPDDVKDMAAFLSKWLESSRRLQAALEATAGSAAADHKRRLEEQAHLAAKIQQLQQQQQQQQQQPR